MTEPIRWIDDPAFKMRTGIHIEDDDALMGGYDLDAMAARLGDAIDALDVSGAESGGASSSAGSAATTLSTKGVIALVTTTAIVSAGLGALIPSLLEPSAPPEVSAAEGGAHLALADDDAVVFKTSLRVAPSREEPLSLEPPSPAPTTSALPERAPSKSTNLAEEIALYERGARALEKGDAASAVDLLRQYRERYPDGQLRAEAALSEFEGLLRIGDDDAAIESALAILSDTAFRGRWDDVLGALSGLARRADRCDEVHARLKLRKLSKRALTRFLKGCD